MDICSKDPPTTRSQWDAYAYPRISKKGTSTVSGTLYGLPLVSHWCTLTEVVLACRTEQVAVRVGNSDPVREGAASNPLCAVADLTSTSAMVDFECTNPVTGYFITVSMNNGGKMNVCGLSANLGFVALPPVTSIVGERSHEARH